MKRSMAKNNANLELVRHLALIVEQAGGTLEQLLVMSGLERTPIVGTSERSEQEANAIAMLQGAIELTGDPALPLHLGRRFDVASLGSYGFAIMSCAELGDCIDLMKRYQKTVRAGPSWGVFNRSDGIAIRPIVSLGRAGQRRIVSELVFSQLCSTTEFLIRDSLDGAELHLSYEAPSHASDYRALLAIPVIFEQPHSQLVLPEALLKRSVRTVNLAGHTVFQQQCEELLRNHNKIENTSAAIRRALLHSAGDFLNARQAARSLNMSERTLRRRLDAEETSFREIKEEVKAILAREYLANTKFTVAQVANLLDYTETVNFRQAFVRWHGITPSQYRQQLS